MNDKPRKRHAHLPHCDAPGHYQFITFRTHDSLDGFLQKLAHSDQPNSKKQLLIDDHLDNSGKGAYLHGAVLQTLYQWLLEQDGELYELVAFSAMPNHVHLLIKPHKPLADTVRQIKGGSARLINQAMGKKGRFWASDYYDRGIRDGRHFSAVYRYIKNNPLKLVSEKDSGGGVMRFYGVYEDE